MSEIEWTDKTWNPIVGCTRHSAACDHCYAIKMAARIAGMKGRPHYEGIVANGDWTGVVNAAPDHIWDIPLRRKTPTVYFVNSMSDVFHPNVKDEWIVRMFDIMERCKPHTFQISTKLPAHAVSVTRRLGIKWPSNVWIGASVGENKFAIPTVRELQKLKEDGAAVVFISAEPLLEALPDLDVSKVDWVIAGGEAGNAKTIRPMNIDWARDLRDRCAQARIPFFFKQWGSHDSTGKRMSNKHEAGSFLDGRQIMEMPQAVQLAVKAKAPVPVVPVSAPPVGASLRITYRDAILALLSKGPMSAVDLRAANGAVDNPHKNLHAWALVDLQREDRVRKRTDGKYGLLYRARRP